MANWVGYDRLVVTHGLISSYKSRAHSITVHWLYIQVYIELEFIGLDEETMDLQSAAKNGKMSTTASKLNFAETVDAN